MNAAVQQILLAAPLFVRELISKPPSRSPNPPPACQPSVTEATPPRNGRNGRIRNSAPTPMRFRGPMEMALSSPVCR